MEKLNCDANVTKTLADNTGILGLGWFYRAVLNGGKRTQTLHNPVMDLSLDSSCSQEGGITLSWVDLFGQGQSYRGMQLRAINYQ